jgi:hypothetical protein
MGLSITVIILLASGCSLDTDYTPVDLSNTVKTEKSMSLDDQEHTLKVALSGMVFS